LSAGGKLDRAGLFHLLIVYVVWGSTYLAIRLAVREGAGFPPFHLAGLRVGFAAAILLGWALMRRGRLRLDRPTLILLAGSGLLMWIGGNGLVTWAEKRADSGLAALLVASMPIWMELLECLVDRRRPTPKTAGSLMIGFSGVALLSWPSLSAGVTADFWSTIALLAAPLWWGIGSLWYTRRRPKDLDYRVSAGYQNLFGGMGFLLLILLLQEPRPAPTPTAWGALAYLTLFGSVIAFTSYIRTLQLLPVNVVMTYAYVNPVIAVFLGWLILSEPVTTWTLAGSVLVIAGVAGIFNNRES